MQSDFMLSGKVTFLKPAELAFVRVTGPYPVSSVAAWQVILDWLDKRGHEPIGHVGYGMALDDPRNVPSEELRYDACIIKPATWAPIDAETVRLKTFDGGAYLQVRHVGSYRELGLVVSEVRDVVIPREGLVQDGTRALITMNYSYPSKTPPGEQISDICIPVFPDRRETVRRPH